MVCLRGWEARLPTALGAPSNLLPLNAWNIGCAGGPGICDECTIRTRAMLKLARTRPGRGREKLAFIEPDYVPGVVLDALQSSPLILITGLHVRYS